MCRANWLVQICSQHLAEWLLRRIWCCGGPSCHQDNVCCQIEFDDSIGYIETTEAKHNQIGQNILWMLSKNDFETFLRIPRGKSAEVVALKSRRQKFEAPATAAPAHSLD
jgi:hypothetical protein